MNLKKERKRDYVDCSYHHYYSAINFSWRFFKCNRGR